MYSSPSAAAQRNGARGASLSTSSKSCSTGGESQILGCGYGMFAVAYAPIGRNIVRTFAPRIHDDEVTGAVPSPASLLWLHVRDVQVSAPQPQTFVTGSASKFCGNAPWAVDANRCL